MRQDTPPWGRDGPAASAATRHARIDPELAADLMNWAQRLSNIASRPDDLLPQLTAVPSRYLEEQVCPSSPTGCRSLVAVYDTDQRRVLYRDTLDMRDPTDQSFIVHELVHHLQFQQRGEVIFSTCEQTLATETQAYHVQNLYQKQFRQWQRMGEIVRFMRCEETGSSEPLVRVIGSPVGAPNQ